MRYRIYRDRNLVRYSDIPNIAFKKNWFPSCFQTSQKVLQTNLTNAPRAQGARHGCCLKSTPRQGGKSESGEDEYWRTVRAVQKQPRCKVFTTPRPPHTEGGGRFVARAPPVFEGCFQWHFGMSILRIFPNSPFDPSHSKKSSPVSTRLATFPGHTSVAEHVSDFQVLHLRSSNASHQKNTSKVWLHTCSRYFCWKLQVHDHSKNHMNSWILLGHLGRKFPTWLSFFGDFIWRSYRFPRNDGVQSMKSAFHEKSGWPWQWHLKMMGPI